MIPLYRQPGLLSEAIHSLIRQSGNGVLWKAVVVLDGCPFQESLQACRGWASIEPRIDYVTKPNGGLSSARNAGVEYFIESNWKPDFIYFLDADNRLTPRALELMVSRLSHDPVADWTYPNISMFGGTRFRGTDVANMRQDISFDSQRLVVENYCEAGSLFRFGVFEAGLRFDEHFRDGYEDWALFLKLASLGSVGVPGGSVGFRYRKRPESMLSESSRRGQGRAAEQIHGLLTRDMGLPRLIRDYNRSYPVLLRDSVTGELRYLSSSSAEEDRRRLTPESVGAAIVSGVQGPGRGVFPRVIAVASPNMMRILETQDRAAVVYWAEQCLTRSPFCLIEVTDRHSGSKGYLLAGRIDDLAKEVLAGPTDWLTDQLLDTRSAVEIVRRVVDFPVPIHQLEDDDSDRLCQELVELVTLLALISRESARVSWPRFDGMSRAQDLMFRFREQWAGDARAPAVLSPPVDPDQIVCFVIPWVGAGGVERVAAYVSSHLRRQGMFTVLILSGQSDVARNELVDAFDMVIPAFDPAQGTFLGTPSPGWDEGFLVWEGHPVPDIERHSSKTGLLTVGCAPTVIIEHSIPALLRSAVWRKAGIRVGAHVHVLDQTWTRRPIGHAWLTVAFEHSLDMLIASSACWREWLISLGVPEEKILLIENEPFADISDVGVRSQVSQLKDVGRVKALFVGRPGDQKRFDRLERVIWTVGDSVEWHLVSGEDVESISNNTYRHGDLTAEAMASLMSACDVLVVTSDWEGVPLVILEAVRSGLIVLAPDLPTLRRRFATSPEVILLPDRSFEEQVTALLNSPSGVDVVTKNSDRHPGVRKSACPQPAEWATALLPRSVAGGK